MQVGILIDPFSVTLTFKLQNTHSRHTKNDQEVLGSITTGDYFLAEFILLFPMFAFVGNIAQLLYGKL